MYGSARCGRIRRRRGHNRPTGNIAWAARQSLYRAARMGHADHVGLCQRHQNGPGGLPQRRTAYGVNGQEEQSWGIDDLLSQQGLGNILESYSPGTPPVEDEETVEALRLLEDARRALTKHSGPSPGVYGGEGLLAIDPDTGGADQPHRNLRYLGLADQFARRTCRGCFRVGDRRRRAAAQLLPRSCDRLRRARNHGRPCD